MAKIGISISKFRFEGTRFISDLRDSVIEIHNLALRDMLEFLVSRVHSFTGETQATFRQFRDYLQEQGLHVDIEDFTQPEVLTNQFRFNKGWNVPAKIKNLGFAGFETAYGKLSVFECTIDRQKFSISVDFQSGSLAFKNNPDLQDVLEEAKKHYVEFFSDGLRILFQRDNIAGRLKSYFKRVTVRS
jgi:hypothetical protein